MLNLGSDLHVSVQILTLLKLLPVIHQRDSSLQRQKILLKAKPLISDACCVLSFECKDFMHWILPVKDHECCIVLL